MKEKKTDIQTIDPRVYAISQKNGLNYKKTVLVNEIINQPYSHKTNAEIYQQTQARQNVSAVVASVEYSKNLKKPSIQKTIIEILTDQDITAENTLEKHKEIRDKALKKQDFTNARETNRDFLKILRVLDNSAEVSDNKLYINNAIIDVNAIDRLIQAKNKL